MFLLFIGCSNPTSSSSSDDSSDNDVDEVLDNENNEDSEDGSEESDSEDEEVDGDDADEGTEGEEPETDGEANDEQTIEFEVKNETIEVTDGQTIRFTAEHSFDQGQGTRNITRYRVLDNGDEEKIESWKVEANATEPKTIEFTIDFDYEYRLDFDGVGNREWTIKFVD